MTSIIDKQIKSAPKAAYWRVSPANVLGESAKRLMLVLRTAGCAYAKQTGGGCTVCGFINHADESIGDDEIYAQLEQVLSVAPMDGVRELDLLTLGSFLNDDEVSPELRERLLTRIAAIDQLKRVSFESRAEYVTVDKLRRARSILANVTVEFGIGLESADDHIRNVVIRKDLSREQFEGVAECVHQSGSHLLVYLLIKPPHLSEAEAIGDAVASARYVFETAQRFNLRARVAFEPVFICEQTPLERLYKKSEYRLVNLWSVIEIIRQVHQSGDIFVGLSDENLSFDRLPSSCVKCQERLVAAIEAFNGTQDYAPLAELDCDCKASWAALVEPGDPA